MLPKFRPIIDTTGSSHYRVGKFLANLLSPLTTYEFTLKDSFQAADHIKALPKELFQNGYQYVSFDVVSLFTNVPLERTVKIILKRIYTDNLIDTKFKKRTLKKLILDTCKKTVFFGKWQFI